MMVDWKTWSEQTQGRRNSIGSSGAPVANVCKKTDSVCNPPVEPKAGSATAFSVQRFALKQSQLGSPIQWTFLISCTLWLVWLQHTHNENMTQSYAVAPRALRSPDSFLPPDFCKLPGFNETLASESLFTSTMAVSRAMWNSFMGARIYCLESELRYQSDRLKGERIPLCVHGIESDVRYSRQVDITGKWISQQELDFLTKLGPCSPDRPYFIDIGAGVGSVSVLAGLLGCKIVAFEPHTANVGRLLRNLKDNNVMRNATVYRNAVTGQRGMVNVHAPANAASDAVVTTFPGTHENEEVFSVFLDDFFVYEGRPAVQEEPQRLMSPADVAVVWVEIDGHEIPALYGMSLALQAGKVPAVRITFRSGKVEHAGCHAAKFLYFMKSIGYIPVVGGKSVPYSTLMEWVATGGGDTLQDANQGLVLDLWFVRRETARRVVANTLL